jgi:hypothetical protein
MSEVQASYTVLAALAGLREELAERAPRPA